MKKIAYRFSFRHVFALASMALATAAFIGCAAETAPDEADDEETAVAQEKIGGGGGGGCCQGGTYYCPKNGTDWDYGCGGASKASAGSACKANCGTTACTDTGWHTYCF